MFFTFRQNNSFGVFAVNDNVDHFVIIEAESSGEADDIGEHIGIYFGGVLKGIDCECCGDRWYRNYGEGTEKPEIYGKSPSEHSHEYIIHYKNGTVERDGVIENV
jgi:hypothetical protein